MHWYRIGTCYLPIRRFGYWNQYLKGKTVWEHLLNYCLTCIHTLAKQVAIFSPKVFSLEVDCSQNHSASIYRSVFPQHV